MDLVQCGLRDDGRWGAQSTIIGHRDTQSGQCEKGEITNLLLGGGGTNSMLPIQYQIVNRLAYPLSRTSLTWGGRMLLMDMGALIVKKTLDAHVVGRLRPGCWHPNPTGTVPSERSPGAEQHALRLVRQIDLKGP